MNPAAINPKIIFIVVIFSLLLLFSDVCLDNCGDKSMITFSKKIVKAFVLESGFQLFEHPMESISFSSIGEGVTLSLYFS